MTDQLDYLIFTGVALVFFALQARVWGGGTAASSR